MTSESRITESYSRFPHSLWSAAGLGLTAKNVLVRLEDFRNKETGQCNPRYEKLAAKLGVCKDSIYEAIKKLAAVGLVEVHKGQRGNQFVIKPRSEWTAFLRPGKPDAEAVSASGKTRRARPGKPDAEAPHPYMNLISKEPYAAADARSGSKEAAAAAVPLARGEDSEPTAKTQAQRLVMELMPQHPEPGNLQKAVSEVGKLLAARPSAATVEAIGRNHAAWRVHWAGYPPGRFIPQLWRWIHDGDWEFPPVERKGALPAETWAERRQREVKESDDEYFLHLAQHGQWDALREYTSDVEKWREKVKALG